MTSEQLKEIQKRNDRIPASFPRAVYSALGSGPWTGALQMLMLNAHNDCVDLLEEVGRLREAVDSLLLQFAYDASPGASHLRHANPGWVQASLRHALSRVGEAKGREMKELWVYTLALLRFSVSTVAPVRDASVTDASTGDSEAGFAAP